MRRHHLTLTASAAAAAVLLGAVPADAGRAATATVTLLNDGRCDPMTAAWNLSWGTARVPASRRAPAHACAIGSPAQGWLCRHYTVVLENGRSYGLVIRSLA